MLQLSAVQSRALLMTPDTATVPRTAAARQTFQLYEEFRR